MQQSYSSPEHSEAHLGRLVKQIDIACERQLNSSLRGTTLTRSQVFMLNSIAHHGGEATLKELENEAGVAQSTSWGVAKRLAEKGLVELVTDPDDARAKIARLTPRGQAEFEKGWRDAMALEAHLGEVFSPEEHKQFVGYLERMRNAVESWEAPTD